MPLTVTVPGVPQPQGSIRSLGRGRPSIHSNADRLLPWREAVIWHVAQAMHAAGDTEVWPLSGPLALDLTFHLPRPKSAPKVRWAPDRKPDLDKLCRSACDSLTQSQAIWDDAQIVDITMRKRYAPEGTSPGLTLTITEAEQVPA